MPVANKGSAVDDLTIDDLDGALTAKQFAQVAHVSVRTAHRMIKDGEVRSIPVTVGVRKVPLRCVDEWFESIRDASCG
jgi:predicted site-specific integrase-resolvase